jgi:hypothetical protein
MSTFGKVEEAGEHVVRDAAVGEVAEKEVALFLVHVERDGADLLGLQGLHERRRVDEAPAAGVDEDRRRLHLGERLGPEQVVGLGRERAVERDEVGLGEQPVDPDVRGPHRLDLGVRVRVEGEEPHPEPGPEDLGRRRPDPPGPDHAGRLSPEVDAEEAAQLEVPLADPVVRAVDAAVEREDQPHRVFGDRIGRIGRHPHHGNAQILGGG